MLTGQVDLHTHTLASDGTQTPSENIRMARDIGLAAVAITDHDTVDGLEEAMEEGERLDFQVVPGVEISTSAEGQDIHMLGYFIDYKDPVFLERLEELRGARDRRNELILEQLRKLGIMITMDDVRNALEPGKNKGTIGRPHLANVLLKKGVVSSMEEAFREYLGKGAKAYVETKRISPETAIKWIHDAGGSAVLAHPGLYKNDTLVRNIMNQGLDGIEVYHSDHTPEDEQRYRHLVEGSGLLITAGSDFHGTRAGKVFHAPMGTRTVSTAILAYLDKRRE